MDSLPIEINILQKIIYKTRTEHVLDLIKEDILSGVLQSGEPLRQSVLAEKYQISRIPIREALLQLEAQGLVRVEAHKGAIVTEISIQEIDELFNLRAILEPYILEFAIPNMDQSCFQQCTSILLKLENALKDNNKVEQWSDYNFQFHHCLYSPAKLHHTLDLVNTLNTRCDRYIRMQLLYTNGIDKAEEEHRELLRLCQSKDTKKASNYLSKHILAASTAIKLFLKSQQ
ncbi:MAG: GntR family transcriptional regulator [Alcanivoracaceae bacterium]|nr:GntR family transcriptional regulator [Alcanivoracaceae bacterium]